jgi:hypothetical protein
MYKCVAENPIPIQRDDNMIFLHSFDDAKTLFSMEYIQHSFIIAVITFDISSDPYLALYLADWADLFDNLPWSTYFVIFEAKDENRLYEYEKLIMQLPEESIFMAYQHGYNSVVLSQYTAGRDLKQSSGLLFHVNHERPWACLSRLYLC